MNATLPNSLAQLAEPPIFVIGLHRSGTTWIFDMLTAHPEVAGVFESGIFATGLGFAPLFNEGHWHEDQGRRELDRRFYGMPTRLYQLVERPEVVSAVRELSAGWLSRALGPGDRYLVEKTPQHLRTMKIIAEVFPGAAFVHVIRDCRDVVVSMKAAPGSWPGIEGQVRIPHVARRWANSLRTCRADAERASLRYLEVRYEEMHRDPIDGLRRLFEFCRIPADRDLAARICEQTSLAKVRRSAFRRRGKVGEWRHDLSLRDRFGIDRAAGDMLLELGYEHSRAWWLDPHARLMRRHARSSERQRG